MPKISGVFRKLGSTKQDSQAAQPHLEYPTAYDPQPAGDLSSCHFAGFRTTVKKWGASERTSNGRAVLGPAYNLQFYRGSLTTANQFAED